ncbi:hypothetical protein PSECIP111951_01153 [Pseudoalteromonas holothuriae]|uniref:Uncharacterized protein n=1 Tax=Pseudoalteromonas holothuriae TaxID=2963714 RepID=A0ABM9GGL8_9GAMM|nr:hypothetical protein [Pseudoalteromonas sp. CIP111951]CAH9055005.1 hypothetical protein PSECIP111951_01153 [Pseudoalteromonas sp. CIP111951]
MILYLYDESGYYVAEYEYEKGTVLPTTGFTHLKPITVSDGKVAQFYSGNWVESEGKTKFIDVTIDKIEGTISGYENTDNEFTVPQQSNDVVATGQLAIPDRKFKVPFKRIDTGRIQLMPAQVVDGQFSMPLKFETNGIWVVNQELFNTDFSEAAFTLNEYRFSVL